MSNWTIVEGIPSGHASIAHGTGTRATGTQAHAEGSSGLAEGSYSHTEGYRGHAKGTASHAEGFATRAEHAGAHSEGYRTFATGQGAHAEGSFSIAGEGVHARGTTPAYNSGTIAQYASLEITTTTVDATTTYVVTAAQPTYFPGPNTVVAYEALIAARRSDGLAGKAWKATAMIRTNGSGIATVVNPVVTVLGGDAAASVWSVDLAAIGGTNNINPRFMGQAATTILWSAKVAIQVVG